MKTANGVHGDCLVCDCPYCRKELIFLEHPHCFEIDEPKKVKETCYHCKKKFYLGRED